MRSCAIARVFVPVRVWAHKESFVDEERQIQSIAPRVVVVPSLPAAVSIPMLFYSHTDTHTLGLKKKKKRSASRKKKEKKILFQHFFFHHNLLGFRLFAICLTVLFLSCTCVSPPCAAVYNRACTGRFVN